MICEDRFLVWEASKKVNAHQRDQLIFGYRNAVALVMDPRCRGVQRKEAFQLALRAETALREFVYPASAVA